MAAKKSSPKNGNGAAPTGGTTKPSKTTKVDTAWNTIFQQLPILQTLNRQGNNYYDISATDIKKIGKEEPRLMTKMDFDEQRPKIMRSNGLSILAIKNGLYRIGRFDPFLALNVRPAVKAKRLYLPKSVTTIDPLHLRHEAVMLDAMLASGALTDVFGEDVHLTIRGRVHSPKFPFGLNGVDLPIDGVQIEVDGGYEGANSINLVEAKIGFRSNLSVRQVAYPHLAWEAKKTNGKTVKSFICFYEEPLIRFIPVLHGLGLWTPDHAQEKHYTFVDNPTFDIHSVQVDPVKSAPPLKDPPPFPQADCFPRVLAMFSTVAKQDDATMTKDELLGEFDLDPRQIDYYANALRWIGLVSKEDGRRSDGEGWSITLTEFGVDVNRMTHAERIEAMARVIFREPLFYNTLHKLDLVDGMFKRWGVITDKTRTRRLQTVRAWINYFLEETEPS